MRPLLLLVLLHAAAARAVVIHVGAGGGAAVYTHTPLPVRVTHLANVSDTDVIKLNAAGRSVGLFVVPSRVAAGELTLVFPCSEVRAAGTHAFAYHTLGGKLGESAPFRVEWNPEYGVAPVGRAGVLAPLTAAFTTPACRRPQADAVWLRRGEETVGAAPVPSDAVEGQVEFAAALLWRPGAYTLEYRAAQDDGSYALVVAANVTLEWGAYELTLPDPAPVCNDTADWAVVVAEAPELRSDRDRLELVRSAADAAGEVLYAAPVPPNGSATRELRIPCTLNLTSGAYCVQYRVFVGADAAPAAPVARVCLPQLEVVAADGGWAPWTAWSPCSASCGASQRTRTRTCTAPQPTGGGRPCAGLATEVQACAMQPCPGKPTGITITPDAVYLLDSEAVTIECVAAGFPQPSVQWFWKGFSVPISKIGIQMSASIAGQYKCIATNAYGSLERIVQANRCFPCPAGQFLPAKPSCACVPCSTCPAGQYAQTPCQAGTGASRADVVCANCTATCPPGQYLTGVCNATHTPVCRPCTACPAGTFEKASCQAAANPRADRQVKKKNKNK